MTLTHYQYSHIHLHIGEGMKVMLSQAANEALRHCRIGKITFKSA